MRTVLKYEPDKDGGGFSWGSTTVIREKLGSFPDDDGDEDTAILRSAALTGAADDSAASGSWVVKSHASMVPSARRIIREGVQPNDNVGKGGPMISQHVPEGSVRLAVEGGLVVDAPERISSEAGPALVFHVGWVTGLKAYWAAVEFEIDPQAPGGTRIERFDVEELSSLMPCRS